MDNNNGGNVGGNALVRKGYELALDGLVTLNSFIACALFVAIAITALGQQSLEKASLCEADLHMEKMSLVWEVVSFACFLFTSLMAQQCKLNLNSLNIGDQLPICLRGTMVISAIASFVGGIFLVVSMVFRIQIRLGMLIYSGSALQAVVPLILVAGFSLLSNFYNGLRTFLR